MKIDFKITAILRFSARLFGALCRIIRPSVQIARLQHKTGGARARRTFTGEVRAAIMGREVKKMEKPLRDADRTARDVNLVSAFLAERDFPILTKEAVVKALGRPADLIILMGGSIGSGCEAAADAYLSGVAAGLMIVGGEGHTTQALRDSVAKRYPDVPTGGRTEADVIADMLFMHRGVPRDKMILETASTNCGENAAFALRTARESGLDPEYVILMQDSSMQRRMRHSFEKAWCGTRTRFFGYAAHVPMVEAADGCLRYVGIQPWGMWPLDRFISLIMGEIPRLHDTPSGYGPLGRGFITRCEVPEDVLAAFSRLSEDFPGAVRPAWRG